MYGLLSLIRRIICLIDYVVFTAFLYLLSFLPRNVTDPFYHRLFRIWSRLFVRALHVNLKLHQKNHHPLPNTFILIANHPSACEDVGIPALFDVTSLAKEEVRDWYILGRIAVSAGTLFVQREDKESRKDAGDEIEETVLAGRSVALYPEGGCKGRRIFESFRYGAFDISLRTGIPILPVFLHYESQEDFEWQPPWTLVDKFWHMIKSQNNRANYYVYDALDPKQFANPEEYCKYAHDMFLKWQERYLD